MEKLEIYNPQNIEGTVKGSGSSTFIYKPVIAPDSPEAGQCHIAFVEVPPGNSSFEYHYHEADEEVFYIISGEGIVRTPKGDMRVRRGDLITFPPGADGAHSITNTSETEKLIYVDFDTHNLPEITHFPDKDIVHVQGVFSSVNYNCTQGEENPCRRVKNK